jgi:hypothetical protein
VSGRSSAGLLGDLLRESGGALKLSSWLIGYDTAHLWWGGNALRTLVDRL